MAVFYVRSPGKGWYKFGAPLAAYPEAVGTVLGINSDVPTTGRILKGNHTDHMIMRVRINLANGKSVVRFCDINQYSDALTDLRGAAAFGSTIRDVVPVREDSHVVIH